MGIVYEAEQVSLGRRVALKVLPSAAALDDKHLQRFKNEAQAAALLAHPHIVPVIAVGQEQGTHFFAMQFIEGHSLSALIAGLRARRRSGDPTLAVSAARNLPEACDVPLVVCDGGEEDGKSETVSSSPPIPFSFAPREGALPAEDRAYFREAARLLLQAAEALDHAHQVGVIHRDVKPGNLLVDGRGNLWVTDFGLARLHAGAGLTVSGDLLGTLRYMSPEQAQVRRVHVDHRTDVYSLGVSAYELLTLEHAFPGDDRVDLLRRIAAEEPPRPRRLNRAVPAELEAVVLKAMEKDPADRYATAQDLADDLRRFLDDQPVRARRPSRWRVAAKWARRHAGLVSTVASAAAVVVVVLAVAVALLTLSNGRLREQETQTQDALRKAEENAGRANRNASRALKVLEDLSLKLATEQVRRDRDLADKVRGALGEALEVYEALAEEEDFDVRLGVARGFARVGDGYYALGSEESAQKAYRQGIALLELLAEQQPQHWFCRLNLSASYRAVAQLHRNAGRRQEAAACLRQALECWERPCPLESCPVAISSAHQMLGEIEAEKGNVPQAMAHYREALAEGPRLTKVVGEASGRFFLGARHRLLGQLLQGEGRTDEAEEHFRQAQELAEALVGDVKDKKVPVEYRNLLAGCWFERAVRREEAKPAEALRFYQQALDLLSALSAENPGAPERRRSVADAHYHLGMVAWVMGRAGEAAEHFRAAKEVFAKLAADVPGGGPGPGEPGQNENSFAWFLATCPDESFREPGRAVDVARKAKERVPSQGDFWNTLGAACLRAGDAKKAVEALEKAVALHQETDPTDWLFLALAHYRLGDLAQARACHDKAIAWIERHKSGGLELRFLRDEAGALFGPARPLPGAGERPR
jgi:serine/threonine protein kinase/tetratricopeptide (TPR) repeat protein